MSGLQNNKPNSIRLDFSSDSQNMVIAFSSLRLESDVPPFEWTGILNDKEKFQSDPTINRRYLNLRPLIENDNGNTKYHVYYSSEYSVAVEHVNHLEEIEGVILHKYLGEGHKITVSMRNLGKLVKILLNAIDIQHKEETIR